MIQTKEIILHYFLNMRRYTVSMMITISEIGLEIVYIQILSKLMNMRTFY